MTTDTLGVSLQGLQLRFQDGASVLAQEEEVSVAIARVLEDDCIRDPEMDVSVRLPPIRQVNARVQREPVMHISRIVTAMNTFLRIQELPR